MLDNFNNNLQSSLNPNVNSSKSTSHTYLKHRYKPFVQTLLYPDNISVSWLTFTLDPLAKL